MSSEFRRCLETLDAAGALRLWQQIAPHLPQPGGDGEALVALHHARTQARSIAIKLRFYSHRWLLDHGYPSGLPDELKPSAERLYPRIAKAVGISVNATNPVLQAVTTEIRSAMENAVLETFTDGHADEPEIVSARMREARETTVKRLIGRITR